jgi:SAM-dependent methyltransferase
MAKSIYTLNTGAASVEDERLNYQHYHMLKPLIGDLLPAVVFKHLKSLPAPRVADIATGTGIWLRDVATELPAGSQLDGYDFDTSKFPPAEAIPANIKLQFGNVLEPFAPDLLGTYDAVHVRLLMYALKADQWIIALKNLKTLLKPGGWLCWGESGYPFWFSLPPTQAYHDWMDIEVKAAIALGRDIKMPLFLLKYTKEAGFVDCEEQASYTISAPLIDQEKMPRIALAIISQSMKGLVDQGGLDGMRTAEDAERIIAAASKAFETSQPNIGGVQVWGRKE